MSAITERLITTVYRAHNPRWSFAPDSGAGAAKHGARFNRRGLPALYTSSSYELAVAEAQQGMPFKLQPLTIVSYDVDHDSVLDLSSASSRAAAGVAFDDLACAWELIAFDGGIPPSWFLADRLIEDGVGAIMVPSFAQAADERSVNIVFWDWHATPPRQVVINDDENRLPRDDGSWR